MNKEELTEKYLAGRRDFSYVDFSHADLRDADLRDADLRDADFIGADLRGAFFAGANLHGALLSDAFFAGANLRGAIGFRFEGAPDPAALRKLVADQIEAHPELHDQRDWGYGDPTECGTPCCVAGWACRLGGGTRGQSVSSAALRLLWMHDRPMPSFLITATREEILAALRA